MTRYIAFLRAINVGGGRSVTMEVLRRIFRALGFSEVASFLASGNIVFETTGGNTRTLEKRGKTAKCIGIRSGGVCENR